MRCTIDCPDKGKCYLERQAQCCPVFRVNEPVAAKRIRRNDSNAIARAKQEDKKNPIPGAAQRVAILDDEMLPEFMKRAKLERLKEVYR